MFYPTELQAPVLLCPDLPAPASITQGVVMLAVHRMILSRMPTVEPIRLIGAPHDIFTAWPALLKIVLDTPAEVVSRLYIVDDCS